MKKRSFYLSTALALLAMPGLISCAGDDLTIDKEEPGMAKVIQGQENVQNYFKGLPAPKKRDS